MLTATLRGAAESRIGGSFDLLDGDGLAVNGLVECGLSPPIERQILAAAITFFPAMVCIELLTRKQIHNPPFMVCVLWRNPLPDLEIWHTRIGNHGVVHSFDAYRLRVV